MLQENANPLGVYVAKRAKDRADGVESGDRSMESPAAARLLPGSAARAKQTIAYRQIAFRAGCAIAHALARTSKL
jgi:hypothetical protein